MPDWLRMIGLYLFATGIFLTFDIGDLLESIKRDNDQRKAREELFHNLTVTSDAPDFPLITPKETGGSKASTMDWKPITPATPPPPPSPRTPVDEVNPLRIPPKETR